MIGQDTQFRNRDMDPPRHRPIFWLLSLYAPRAPIAVSTSAHHGRVVNLFTVGITAHRCSVVHRRPSLISRERLQKALVISPHAGTDLASPRSQMSIA